MKKNFKKKKNNGTGSMALRIFVNIFIVVFVVVYVSTLLPIVKFMRNKLKEEPPVDNGGEVVVIKPGDSVIDLSGLQDLEEVTPTPDPEEITEAPTETPEPTEAPTEEPTTPPATQDPNATPTPTPPPTPTPSPTPKQADVASPTGTPAQSVPYVPDPIVEGVSKTAGCNVKLQPDAKNILLLGYDNKSDLTDTMIVVSICERTKTVDCYSLARDAYIPYTGAVQDYLVRTGLNKSKGIYKLNACYPIGKFIKYKDGKFGNSGIDFLCHIINEMMPDANMHIDDYIFVDPDGMAKFVDLFGGADVYFSEDRWVMNSATGKTELKYTKGYHHLNGAETVTFLRTRNRYNENGRISSTGDPYRKANQLRFIRDFSKKVITIENVGRINEIMSTVSEFVYHSINTPSQLATYTKFATDFAGGKYTVTTVVVSGRSIDPVGDHASYVNLMY